MCKVLSTLGTKLHLIKPFIPTKNLKISTFYLGILTLVLRFSYS